MGVRLVSSGQMTSGESCCNFMRNGSEQLKWPHGLLLKIIFNFLVLAILGIAAMNSPLFLFFFIFAYPIHPQFLGSSNKYISPIPLIHPVSQVLKILHEALSIIEGETKSSSCKIVMNLWMWLCEAKGTSQLIKLGIWDGEIIMDHQVVLMWSWRSL